MKLLQAVEEEEETLGGENSESEDELEICDYQSGRSRISNSFFLRSII